MYVSGIKVRCWARSIDLVPENMLLSYRKIDISHIFNTGDIMDNKIQVYNGLIFGNTFKST